MRSPFWCSALLVVVLAGCGGRPALDAQTKTVATSTRVQLERVSFRGYRGRVVRGYLAVTRRPGRHPAVVYLHGSGGSAQDFLVAAARFAQAGGVGLTIQQPNDATTFDPLVGNTRRALDLLAARSDVDPHRLGVAGLSLGAETAAIVAGDDSRPHAFSLMSARGVPDVVLGVHRSTADFFVQNGLRDQVIPRNQLQATASAIRGHVTVRWYEAPHTLNARAFADQLAWLRAELQPGR